MRHYRNYVNGKWIESTKTFEDRSPIDGSMIAIVHEADQKLVHEAILAGHDALAGEWGKTTINQRVALLRRIADQMELRQDDLLAVEMADTGKPHSMASTIDIPRGIANFRIFADMLATAPLESYRLDLPDGAYSLNYVARKPLGVVGVISPWNLPLLLLTWKVAPALACGNAIVVKPSEDTPGSATILAEIMEEAGVPAGVFNLVHGFGPNSAGEFITTDSQIDAITFTGESRTGTTIMRAAAEGIKPISFELGGKNAAIIFADCDFEKMLDGMMLALFQNSGQVCLCSERIYVERPIYEKFCAALRDRITAMKIDWPHDPTTQMGPLISTKHREKVLSYFALAREEGATFLVGGSIPHFGDQRDAGAWIEPTVITGLSDEARCVREEVFGPFCHISPFDHEKEAIQRANDTKYGLAASIWTTNLNRAHRVSESMRTGISWVNTWFMRDLRTPFGGAGISGIGREGGMHSLNFYSELTNVCIRIDQENVHE